MPHNFYLKPPAMDVEEIQRLLHVVVSPRQRNYALQWAAEEGQTRSIRALLAFADPKSNNNLALCVAAEKGYTECVKLLLPGSLPLLSNDVLFAAVNGGHVDCVKLLLAVSDPKEEDSVVLQQAVLNGNIELIDLLRDVCDAQLVLDHLQSQFEKRAQWGVLEDKINQRQHDILSEQVGSDTYLSKNRKI